MASFESWNFGPTELDESISSLQKVSSPIEAPIKKEGVKFDQGKNRLDLLPIDAIETVGQVLSFGAAKYGERNWEAGMSYGRLIGAALRHLFAYARGIDKDEETGLPHLSHAACCILFLLSYQLRGIGLDDRAKTEKKDI